MIACTTRSGTIAAESFNSSSVVSFSGALACLIHVTRMFSEIPFLWSSITRSTVGGGSCAAKPSEASVAAGKPTVVSTASKEAVRIVRGRKAILTSVGGERYTDAIRNSL
jgi:hypothetical protein